MHSIEIPDNGLFIQLPEHWDEATEEQACKIFEMSFNHLAGMFDRNEHSLQMLFFLTGMKRSWRTKVWERMAPEELVLEKNAKLYQMGEKLCNWPFTDSVDNPTIKYETVKNNLPTITIGRKKIYGPADLISDLSFGEFRTAINEMNNHFQLAKYPDTADQSDEALNRFIACLYRPAKPSRNKGADDDDRKVRQSFNRENISTKYTAKLPIWQKTMILLWFSYCVKYLQTEDLIIEGNTINLSVLFPEANKSDGTEQEEANGSGTGWAGLLFEISESGPFGDVEKTDKQGIFDILLYLYKNHLKNQKQNRKQ